MTSERGKEHDFEQVPGEEILRLQEYALARISQGILITDTERRIIYCNKGFEELTGYAKPEILGKNCNFLQGPDTDPSVIETLRKTLQVGKAFRGEILNYRKNGEPFWNDLSITPEYTPGGQLTRFIGTQCDITERKAAEAALRESEERFKSVARATTDAIWDWDLETNILWWNDGMQKLFGYKKDEVEPGIESWNNRIHPEDRGRVINKIHAAIAGQEETWSDEYRFLCRNGSTSHVLDRGFILRGPGGKPLRMIGGMSDLTEKKKWESQFLRAQRLESIGTLAGGIAHDLNNILTPIMMCVDILKMGRPAKQRDELLETISSSARRGAEMLGQVLSFARGVDGRQAEIQIPPLISEMEKMLRDTFPKNISLELSVSPDLRSITGDLTQLHQVLLNLCVNARDAMPEGGKLTLSAENVKLDSQQHVVTGEKAKAAGDFVCLYVDDTGSGIPAEIIEHIFDPFFTTKAIGHGTGLGLSTSMAIVKSHGGLIRVHSEAGKGARFSIFLPAYKDGFVHADEGTPQKPKGEGETVLVVDDELPIRDITQQTLEAYGYRVLTAADGAEAIRIYSLHPDKIDVVLMDMMMPVMDGASAIQKLLEIHPQLKIVAVSGINLNVNAAQAAGNGVKDFLAKPYSSEELLQCLKSVLHKSKETSPISVQS